MSRNTGCVEIWLRNDENYRLSRIISTPFTPQAEPESQQNSPKSHLKAYFNTNCTDVVRGT